MTHHDGQGQAAQQHHEHTADVLNTQGVSLGVLALVLGRGQGLVHSNERLFWSEW